MNRGSHPIPKVIVVAVLAVAAWFIYTNQQPVKTPEDTAVKKVDTSGVSSDVDDGKKAASPTETPWKSGYSLTVQKNAMAAPTEREAEPETGSTTSAAKQAE
jgi:hypothetical protein